MTDCFGNPKRDSTGEYDYRLWLTDREKDEGGLHARSLTPRSIFECPFVSYKQRQPYIEFYNGYAFSKEGVDFMNSHCMERRLILTDKDNTEPQRLHFRDWMLEGYIKGRLRIHSTPHKGLYGAVDNQLVLYFGTSSFYDFTQVEKDYTKYKYAMKFLEKLPASEIPTILTFSDGVVGNDEVDPKRCVLENEKLPFLMGVRIPKVDNMKLKRFVITREHFEKLKGLDNNYFLFKSILGLHGIKRQDFQGICFMHSKMGERTTYTTSPLVKLLQKLSREYPATTMAGGVVPTLIPKGPQDAEVIATGFLVIGKSTEVKVISTCFDGPKVDSDSMAKLLKLKTKLVVPRDPEEKVASFAIFFGSKDRGMKMYGVPGAETNHFIEAFDSTFLTGAFVPFQFGGNQLESKNASVFFIVSYLYRM